MIQIRTAPASSMTDESFGRIGGQALQRELSVHLSDTLSWTAKWDALCMDCVDCVE